MAEIVLGAFIDVLFEKLASGDLIKLARSEGIETQLKKWKKTLSQIEVVLADAEQKQIKDRGVELWLQDLQDLSYDIDDVLDDLATEAMRRSFDQETYATSSTNKVFKFFPTCCTNFTPHNIMYGHKMSSKLDEITTKLHHLDEQKNSLRLNVNVERPNRTYRKLEETSLVDESKVMGREGDKEALLEKLLGKEACNQNVSIVSIVGLGGIGKTTLARVLYNDEKVKDHFELRAWVCVSEEFDVFNISKVIFQAVAGTNQDFANLDLLHVALKEKLSKKRFLVVLDDVWNENYMELELLQRPFAEGAPGSKIIVTTRKSTVTSMLNSSQSYDLDVLSEEKALSLFARHALEEENFDKHPSLKGHGEGIVKKCGRLPLALITLGTMLRLRRDDHEQWEEVLKSEIWDLPDENHILPALRLSYYNLPSHLKQLFAYCSLFPKDYFFDKNKLVLLWMAQGFLNQTNGNKSKESLGLQYFEELKSRSFFQASITNYRQSGYIMHDLINDLATSVAGGFFFRLDDTKDKNNEKGSFKRLRHVSVIGEEYGRYRKFKELGGVVGLRTFLPLSLRSRPNFHLSNNAVAELLPQLRFVRVLSLSHHSITEVPQSIGTLKHIRYLNFSQTSIERLPEQVGDLYNLQSLLLSGCELLSSLPINFEKLIALRHLDISNTRRLKKMPLGISGLTDLQTLSKVIIEGCNGFKISELENLSNLKGCLDISGLDTVVDLTQVESAKLQQKKGLDDLVMEWNHVFDDSQNHMIECKVLEGLRPHDRLKKLKILFYGGTIFPSWIRNPSFDELTELGLHDCIWCTDLPTLGHLPSLKRLYVDGMDGMKTFSFELPDSFHGTAFPSLEVLCFRKMQGWEKWSTRLGDNNDGTSRSFPCLRELYVRHCPKLLEISIDLIPSLRTLQLEGCSGEVFQSMVGASSSICYLNLKDVSCGSRLGSYNCPDIVESLEISCCDSLTSLTFSTMHELPSSLKHLSIEYCDNLESISDKGFGILPLQSLKINACKNLKVLPHEHLESLTSLRQLDITRCPSMNCSFLCGLWPPNLRSLKIGGLEKPMSEWGMQNYPSSLVGLGLYGENSGVVSFVANAEDVTSSSFLLPPSLTSLSLRNFMDVESVSEVLQHLPCLKDLYIYSCPKLKDLPETDTTNPSSLRMRPFMFGAGLSHPQQVRVVKENMLVLYELFVLADLWFSIWLFLRFLVSDTEIEKKKKKKKKKALWSFGSC
ncbi:hypothetical protein OSB04_013111 [Centaurea solstitialis]|uniref:Disease resistance RPP13-like protein 1 n=1 Tax=Centaurea solstitialis TaxID=347529 RepID=A0AA38WF67_9ASTR|nr:hypothetical protein OSB04_013111 [Centaurea solstitialis]